MIQNSIRLFCTIYNSMAMWLFVICGRLLVIYHRKITHDLIGILSKPRTINIDNNETIWSTLNQFRVLREVHLKLFYDYRFILIGNVLLNLILIHSCSYYLIEFLDLTWVGVFWEVSVVIEFTFRFWLICHTADHIHSSVSRHLLFWLLTMLIWYAFSSYSVFFFLWKRY